MTKKFSVITTLFVFTLFALTMLSDSKAIAVPTNGSNCSACHSDGRKAPTTTTKPSTSTKTTSTKSTGSKTTSSKSSTTKITTTAKPVVQQSLIGAEAAVKAAKGVALSIPSADSNVVANLNKGTKVTVVAKREPYTQVLLSNGNLAWIYTSSIAATKYNAAGTKVANYRVQVTTASVTLRETVSPTSDAIGAMGSGTIATALKVDKGYVYVKLANGRTGWISGNYVQFLPKAAPVAPQPSRAQINAGLWATSPHSHVVDEGTGNPADNPHMRGGNGSTSNCGKCHASQGFTEYVTAVQALGGFDATIGIGSTLASITLKPLGPFPNETAVAGCTACHTNPSNGTLRITGIVGLQTTAASTSPDYTKPSMKVNAGKAAVCFICHDYRRAPATNIPDTPTSSTSMRGPHNPAQTEMLLGFGGAEVPGKIYNSSPHGAIVDSCITCHMAKTSNKAVGGHTYLVKRGDVENLTACLLCHPGLNTFNRRALGDYDGDKQIEGIQDEIDGLIVRVKEAISDKLSTVDGVALGTVYIQSGYNITAADNLNSTTKSYTHKWDTTKTPAGWVPDPNAAFWKLSQADSQRIYNAMYNIDFVRLEGSRGVHNPLYAIQLLQQSWIDLEPGKFPPFRVR